MRVLAFVTNFCLCVFVKQLRVARNSALPFVLYIFHEIPEFVIIISIKIVEEGHISKPTLVNLFNETFKNSCLQNLHPRYTDFTLKSKHIHSMKQTPASRGVGGGDLSGVVMKPLPPLLSRLLLHLLPEPVLDLWVGGQVPQWPQDEVATGVEASQHEPQSIAHCLQIIQQHTQ